MTLRAISYGGGVQSTALLVLAIQGIIDFPVALFANVGDDSENPGSIEFVGKWAKPYAADNGYELIELHKVRRDGTPVTLRLGGMCSGIGGLEAACAAVFGADLEWVCENETHASTVLAARHPNVPNLGDLRTFDWSTAAPVDVLCAGFPCQGQSQAGSQKGIHDERWLFDDIANAVGVMGVKPRWVVLENVPGLFTVNNGGAMGRVVHRLAALGYVGRYRFLRASDVGAPHRRDRVFIVAYHPDPAGLGRREGPGLREDEPGGFGWPRPDDVRAFAVDTGGDNPEQRGVDRDVRGPSSRDENQARQQRVRDTASDPSEETADTDRDGRERFAARDVETVNDAHIEVGDDADRRDPDAPDTDRAGRGERRGPVAARAEHDPVERESDRARWGEFWPAIDRWQRIFGQPAPSPVDDKGRLNPPFVEWMMGYPAGWATDLLGRTASLRCLGNAVVSQQAEAAIRSLLEVA